MNSTSTIHRRAFLGHTLGAAAAAGLSMSATLAAGNRESGPDDWIREVKGTHRCLFDFPAHNGGLPLIHMLNYMKTYQTAYGAKPGEVNAVGTLYFVGPTSSIPLNQSTVNLATHEAADLKVKGRHDPCIVPRAVPVVEAVAACVVLDLLLERLGSEGAGAPFR